MIPTASPEQTKEFISQAEFFGFQIQEPAPRRRPRSSDQTVKSGLKNVGAETIRKVQTCFRCNLIATCRDATEITGESPEPGNFTCYAVNEGFPLVLIRQ